MFKRVMIVGLFVIGIIATLGVEANAGCLPQPPSPKYCAPWVVGSLIGQNLCQIDATIFTKGCTPGVTCPETTYTVSGTINPETGQVCDFNNPASCVTPVLVTCWQKKCENNPNQPQCGVEHQTTSTFNSPGLLTEATEDAACQKKNCRVSKTSATFFTEEDLSAESVCAPGHVVKSAIVLQFVGETTCCSGGYDVNGACCQDQNRQTNGTCALPATTGFKTIKQICCNGETLAAGEEYQCFLHEDTEGEPLDPGTLPAGCNVVNQ